MTAMTPAQLTKEVLAAHSGTPDPRLRELLAGSGLDDDAACLGHLGARAVRDGDREWVGAAVVGVPEISDSSEGPGVIDRPGGSPVMAHE